MPYELLPKGFMDSDQVARSKATVHSGIYQMEYGACFTRDSQGFFKRTLIESCVVSDQNQIKDSQGNEMNLTQQVRNIQGRAVYQSGKFWVDSKLQNQKAK